MEIHEFAGRRLGGNVPLAFVRCIYRADLSEVVTRLTSS